MAEPYVIIGMPIPKDCKVDIYTAMFCGALMLHKRVDFCGEIAHEAELARNVIADKMLKKPHATHVFFIDADTRPPDDAIAKLLACDVDIVAGVTPMLLGGDKYWSASKKTGGREYRWIPYGELPTQLFEADSLGGTTVLIKRKVFETMEWPYYKTVYRQDGSRLGEDVYFCQKAQASGFKLWVDPSVVCGHQQYNNLADWFNFEVTKEKVSIVIPIIRPDSAQRCIEAIHKNAGVPESQYEIVMAVDEERIGCPKMVKSLVGKSKYELVMFLGDDTIPQKDFLKKALQAMSKLPEGWGMVGLNDLHHNGNTLATHWMAHKKLLPLLEGEFFHTGYKHTFCDNELLTRCKRMGRYIWADDAVVEHKHPVFENKKFEGDYARIYSKEYTEHDQQLFTERMAV